MAAILAPHPGLLPRAPDSLRPSLLHGTSLSYTALPEQVVMEAQSSRSYCCLGKRDNRKSIRGSCSSPLLLPRAAMMLQQLRPPAFSPSGCSLLPLVAALLPLSSYSHSSHCQSFTSTVGMATESICHHPKRESSDSWEQQPICSPALPCWESATAAPSCHHCLAKLTGRRLAVLAAACLK